MKTIKLPLAMGTEEFQIEWVCPGEMDGIDQQIQAWELMVLIKNTVPHTFWTSFKECTRKHDHTNGH